jgi:hypothetical protein
MKLSLPQKPAGVAAMTLVELLLAIGIGLTVLASVGALMAFTLRSFVALGNYNELDQASREALDKMSREVRQATNVYAYTTNIMWLNSGSLIYWWNPPDRKVYRWSSGNFSVLLEQCDYLRFGVSQRNPSNNFSFYPASDKTTAKLVDVSWTCSRQIFQQKVNTESVQTAKIVLRN